MNVPAYLAMTSGIIAVLAAYTVFVYRSLMAEPNAEPQAIRVPMQREVEGPRTWRSDPDEVLSPQPQTLLVSSMAGPSHE